MHILGIPIDNLSHREIREKILSFLEEPVYHRIATVNPEFLLLAQKDRSFKNSLDEADLRVADGAGLSFAFWLSGQKLLCRFPGADLMEEVLKVAEERGLGVFLALRHDGLSSYEEIQTALLKKYPKLRLNGKDYKEFIPNSQFPIHDSIVLCNFGIPHQEIFLAEVRKNPGNVRLVLGVGGSFDYLTGKLPRAPKLLRRLGLEWLWRFLLQPSKRAKRVWRSTIIFPFKVFWQKKRTRGEWIQ